MTGRIRKELEAKGYADTRKYRYQIFDRAGRRAVKRIELAKLDTTAALDGWQIVEVKRCREVEA